MRWIVLVALLFAVEARAQDVGSTMFVASDVDSKRFALLLRNRHAHDLVVGR